MFRFLQCDGETFFHSVLKWQTTVHIRMEKEEGNREYEVQKQKVEQ
ncbi:hypothetical protein J2Z37_004685 [Ammoniphilus resinae]|uniref:Uncharacterized protein n=1 Tax=Ammoniphilus resinae TaxID=861532 RepID=A0ABS4GWL5_9BACL|nr:hypothetical protein [Ammoniphilus resinae]